TLGRLMALFMKKIVYGFAIGIAFYLVACRKSDDPVPTQPLTIVSFTGHARGGETITISGSGFSPIAERNNVSINGENAVVTIAEPGMLQVKMPAAAGDGKLKVTVGEQQYISNADIIYDWVAEVSTLMGGPGLPHFGM